MRILFIILLPVILYPIILIYFNKYQDILIKSEFAAIERQGLTLTKALALAENQYGLIQNNQIFWQKTKYSEKNFQSISTKWQNEDEKCKMNITIINQYSLIDHH